LIASRRRLNGTAGAAASHHAPAFQRAAPRVAGVLFMFLLVTASRRADNHPFNATHINTFPVFFKPTFKEMHYFSAPAFCKMKPNP
jgi:hypothetical protein